VHERVTAEPGRRADTFGSLEPVRRPEQQDAAPPPAVGEPARRTDTFGNLEPVRRPEQHEAVPQPAAGAEPVRRPDGFAPSPVRRAESPVPAGPPALPGPPAPSAPSGLSGLSGPPVPSALTSPEPTSTLPAPQKPVVVPSPPPVPTTAATGLGPSRPTSRHQLTTDDDHETPVGQQEDDELPVLPQRAPGRSYNDLRAGGNGGVTEEFVADPADAERPPPLPQRRGTHLREELLEPAAPTKPVPGHNTSLMKTVQAGRDHWLADQQRDASTDIPNRGDSTPWPTT
jgi:hypothetical protein